MQRQIASTEFMERGLTTTPDIVWTAPSGDIVGVFYKQKLYNNKEAFVNEFGTDYMHILDTLPEFPIGAGKYILKYLKSVIGDSATAQYMGRMISNASDWITN